MFSVQLSNLLQPNKHKKPLSFFTFFAAVNRTLKNVALFWLQSFRVVVLFHFLNFSVSIISQPQQISFLTEEGKVMPNKLTLTCSSVGAVGGFQLPHLVTSQSCQKSCWHKQTPLPALCGCCLWVVVVVWCQVSSPLLLFVAVLQSPLPGFRCLARLFSGPRTASAAHLYLRPPGPRDSCVKRFPLTSPDWVSFTRFFCTPTQLPIPPSPYLFDRTN